MVPDLIPCEHTSFGETKNGLKEQPLVVQDDIEQRTVDFQAAVVIDKAHFAKPVHEQANSRAGSANDLSQRLLADLWNHRLGLAILPEIGEEEEHPCQPLFAGVEELVHQILLNPNIAREQMMKHQIRTLAVHEGGGPRSLSQAA